MSKDWLYLCNSKEIPASQIIQGFTHHEQNKPDNFLCFIHIGGVAKNKSYFVHSLSTIVILDTKNSVFPKISCSGICVRRGVPKPRGEAVSRWQVAGSGGIARFARNGKL
ncbi:MAG: hypothetical protein PHC50_02645 [Candidatus Cloacimonetes bacterium]|nr:hypothetical protein [Candidatus Cloacimonadota bacterium]